MSKYVNADALISEYETEIVDYDEDLQKHFVVKAVPTEYIKSFPEADVREIRRGKWIDTRKGGIHGETIYRCSCCGNEREAAYIDEENYCWKCGAKMDLGEEEK